MSPFTWFFTSVEKTLSFTLVNGPGAESPLSTIKPAAPATLSHRTKIIASPASATTDAGGGSATKVPAVAVRSVITVPKTVLDAFNATILYLYAVPLTTELSR